MPPLPVIENTFRCALNWTEGTGRRAVNVMHLRSEAAETATDCFNGLEDSVTGNMWYAVHAAWQVTSVSVTPLDGISATTEFATTDTDDKWNGSGAGDTIPAMSTIVKLNTGLRGRSHRGRLFIPSIAENMTANGVIDPTAVDLMQAAWTTFLTAILDFSKQLVVASYKLASVDQVSSVLVENIGGTQRRRQERLRA